MANQSKQTQLILTWTETQIGILDAAERLFAAQGFGSTSLRMIVAEAGVNLAGVNYHFGSKEGLIQQMFLRRIEPINQERIQSLDELQQSWAASSRKSASTGQSSQSQKVSRTGQLRLKAIIRAFVEPPLLLSHDVAGGGAQFMQVLGRVFTEPDEALFEFFVRQFDEVVHRYIEALGSVLVHLSPSELLWRFQFMLGSMAHTISMPCKMKDTLLRVDPTHTAEREVMFLVDFVAGGMLAPSNPACPSTDKIIIKDVFNAFLPDDSGSRDLKSSELPSSFNQT